MSYDGSLKFDTKIDTTGFMNGLGILKKAGVAGGAAITAGLGAAIKKGMDFEAQMSTVKSISGATADEMVLLKKKAEEMGAKTVFSASESGKAFEYMAMAGWKTEDMLGGIEGIMNLAAASGESLATTSDIVTDALTAFGLKASDSAMFADVLAAAASNSNTNVGMMGETFKYVAPVAGSLGYNVKDVAVGIGLMANAGIKGGQAGTSLRAVLTRLVKPTKQSALAMDKLGISITDSKGQMKPFNQLMLDLRASFSKLTPAEKASNAALLGGQEAMSGLLAIVNASDEDFNKLTGAINNSTGAAEEMSEIRLDNLSGDIEELSGAAETLGLRFYDGVKEPIREAVQSATGDIDTLCSSLSNGELSGALDNVGDALGSLVSGAASLATGAVPMVISGISALSANITPLSNTLLIATGVIGGYKTAVGLVTTATSLWGAATAALSNPFGIAGIAIGGLAAAGIAVYNSVKNAETEFYNMGDALDETAQKYQAAKDKAALTEDYAQKWKDLNKAISEGSLSGVDLKTAEAERKSIEEWFIQNYGKYITAEEEKNGIREETIDAISEQVQLLSEQQRLELENQALERQREIPELTKNISQMQAQNKELGNNNTKLLQNNNVILKATQAWNSLTYEQKMSGKYQDVFKKTLDDINAALGTNYSGLDQVNGAYAENDAQIKKNKDAIEENNAKINDGTESLQSYADTCGQLIQLSLGDTLQGFAAGFGLVKQAQEEINTSGKISGETLQALIDKYPEMKEGLSDSDKAPQLLADKMRELQTKLDEAKKKAEDFGTELNGLPKDIDIDIHLNVPEIPQFAHGTKGANEGPAIVNDGNGPELIQSRGGAFRMVRSTGAALTWLNAGDRVYTAEQTRRMLRGIPHYAGGIGNEGYVGTVSITSFIDKVPEAFERALEELELRRDLDVIDETEYYNQLSELRNKHFQKGSDKWWKYEKEIYNFRKEQAEKTAEAKRETELSELDRQLNLELISEAEYYKELEAFRDRYYAEGEKEYQDYSDKIYKYQKSQEEKAVSEQFDRLKKSLDRGYISEREYYGKLEDLRDTYFSEGSEKWQKYTDEITDYYRGKVTGMTSALNNELNSAAKLFYNNSIILVGEGKGKELTKDGWIDHEGEDITLGGLELNDYDEEIKEAEEYYEVLKKIKELGLNDGVLDYLAGLGVSEGLKQAKIFLEATDEQLRKSKEGYEKLDSIHTSIAEMFYGDGMSRNGTDEMFSTEEIKKSAGEVGETFGTELEKYFSEVPEGFYDYGVSSADSFGDGFIDTIKSVMDRIASEIKADIEIASEKLKSQTGGGTVINNYNTTNASYTVGSSKQTTTEQLAEIRRNEEFERLRG